VTIEWVDPSLAVEDVLEMVQGGIFHLTIVEQPIAERWGKILPKLRFDRQVVISDPGRRVLVRAPRCLDAAGQH
jgi:membrane-bound lytic murein transglycosylase MltF